MKNNGIVLNICITVLLALFFFSCDSGITISEEDFRGVASFEIPALDEPNGINAFTATFSDFNSSAAMLYEKHGISDYLYLSDLAEDKTQLSLQLHVDGLVVGEHSNVKVTANYTSLTSLSKDLVSRIQFDRYGEMVFEANTGLTAYDPSTATVIIDLNTKIKPQLGYITFTFDFAKSVYDQTKSTKTYTLFISTQDAELTPFISFATANIEAQDSSIDVTNFHANGFTAVLTNDLSLPANLVTQNIQVNLLNVEPEYPLSIRLAESSSQGGVELLQTESTDGNFMFTLNYASETNKIKTTENSYVFEITDQNGYYQGMSEPLQITVEAIRTYPTAPNLGGIFPTNGDASPWSWRMQNHLVWEEYSWSWSGGSKWETYISRSNVLNVSGDIQHTHEGGLLKDDFIENVCIVNRNNAIFENSQSSQTGERDFKDVHASAGWLYSDIFTIYPDIDYRITATVAVGAASDSDRDLGGDRVRMYFVPLTNEAKEFTLSNAGGTALIKIYEGESVNQPYIDLASGSTHNIDVVFSTNETTKMRLVFEKGQPDWSSVNDSKMAGQEVIISNVSLDYVIK